MVFFSLNCRVDHIYFRVNETVIETIAIVGKQDVNEKLYPKLIKTSANNLLKTKTLYNVKTIVLVLLTISSFHTENKISKNEHGNHIGFFNKYNMNICVLNEKKGTVNILIHLEGSESGLY
jgi:hypothetical protein